MRFSEILVSHMPLNLMMLVPESVPRPMACVRWKGGRRRPADARVTGALRPCRVTALGEVLAKPGTVSLRPVGRLHAWQGQYIKQQAQRKWFSM